MNDYNKQKEIAREAELNNFSERIEPRIFPFPSFDNYLEKMVSDDCVNQNSSLYNKIKNLYNDFFLAAKKDFRNEYYRFLKALESTNIISMEGENSENLAEIKLKINEKIGSPNFKCGNPNLEINSFHSKVLKVIKTREEFFNEN